MDFFILLDESYRSGNKRVNKPPAGEGQTLNGALDQYRLPPSPESRARYFLAPIEEIAANWRGKTKRPTAHGIRTGHLKFFRRQSAAANQLIPKILVNPSGELPNR